MHSMIEKLFLKFYGAVFVFEDYYNNKYYELTKKKDYFGKNMRYVIYAHSKNASFIPRICDEWLRYNLDNESLIESNKIFQNLSYIKPHKPNLSGTKFRHLPCSHPLMKKNKENESRWSKLYHEWRPND